MALYIGNPTNVVVAEAYNISFITYSAWMLLPTVVCILISYVVLRILFRGDYYLPRHIQPPDADPKSVLIDPHGAIFGLALLACCLATLVGTSFASVPVWMVTLPFAFVMFLRDIRHDLGISFSRMFNIKRRYPRPVLNTAKYDNSLVANNAIQLDMISVPSSVHTDTLSLPVATNPIKTSTASLRSRSPIPLETPVMQSTSFASSVRSKKRSKYTEPIFKAYNWFSARFPTLNAVFLRMPWSILPFSLGMFVLIEALSELGWIGIFATAMSVFAKNYVTAVFGMVFVSIIACQLLNNLVRNMCKYSGAKKKIGVNRFLISL